MTTPLTPVHGSAVKIIPKQSNNPYSEISLVAPELLLQGLIFNSLACICLTLVSIVLATSYFLYLILSTTSLSQ